MPSEPSISIATTDTPHLPELEILLRLCARSLTDLPPGAQINWNRLLQVAERHRVMPLLYANLKRVDMGDVPAEVMSVLRGDVQSNAGRTLQLAGELRRLLIEFERAQIPVIAFKGIALAAMVYGDLSLRDAGDLDLLVHRDERIVVRGRPTWSRLGLPHRLSGLPAAARPNISAFAGLANVARNIFSRTPSITWSIRRRSSTSICTGPCRCGSSRWSWILRACGAARAGAGRPGGRC